MERVGDGSIRVHRAVDIWRLLADKRCSHRPDCGRKGWAEVYLEEETVRFVSHASFDFFSERKRQSFREILIELTVAA